MASKNDITDCKNTWWWIAAAVGLLAWIILFMMADFRFVSAVVLGVLIAIAAGFILNWIVCGKLSDVDEQVSPQTSKHPAAKNGESTAATVASTATPTDSGNDATASTAGSEVAATASASVAATNATPSTEFTIQSSKPLAGQEELASRKGDWKYEAEADAPVVKPKKATPAKKKAPAKAATPAKAPAKTAAAPTASAKPASLLSAARAEGKDDLKLISGVGPKLEQTLNDLGVYHFDQVSKWKKKDIAWVDGNLRFKGRIERDDWMSQAKILAKGGETEFSKKKKK
jgi:predicted flap endonuclease-1-like 5' DNA nuclease